MTSVQQFSITSMDFIAKRKLSKIVIYSHNKDNI